MAVEEVGESSGAAAFRFLNQGENKAVQVFRLAVVGVQRDENIVFRRHEVDIFRKGNCAEYFVLDGRT